MYPQFLLCLWLCASHIALVNSYEDDHLVALWDFTHGEGLGWGSATSAEQGIEVDRRGGSLRGAVTRNTLEDPAHLDSPGFNIDVNGRHVIVLRMKYGGPTPVKGAVQTKVHLARTGVDRQSEVEEDESWASRRDTVLTYFDQVVVNDNSYHTYIVPIYTKVSGNISQFRLFPAILFDAADEKSSFGYFAIDWIRVVRVPVIMKVEGCIDKHFKTDNIFDGIEAGEDPDELRPDGYYLRRGFGVGEVNVSPEVYSVNDNRHNVTRSYFLPLDGSLFAQTFNCPRKGGGWIQISGRDFGNYNYGDEDVAAQDTVTVGGRACTALQADADTEALRCKLPSGFHLDERERVKVRVAHPDLPLVYDERNFLSYTVPPAALQIPVQVSNVKARAITVSWEPPPLFHDAITTTGYVVYMRVEGVDNEYREVATLGNVTSTEITGLGPNTEYSFRVAAVAEDQREDWQSVDLYGRRRLLSDAQIGTWSNASEVVMSLGEDFAFRSFDANASMTSGALDTRSSRSPLGQHGGEGHFGLALVGAASLEHCNRTHSCCDASGDTCCFHKLNSNTNLSTTNQSIFTHHNDIVTVQSLPAPLFNATCGKALRITGSQPQARGAVWYQRQLNVREGFETQFSFKLTDSSQVCTVMNDVDTHCRPRGADGFAFVVQSYSATALGEGGAGLGYSGLTNALAVEFDNFFNPERLDPYDNHVAILLHGSNHSNELGHAFPESNLGGSVVDVKIEYRPTLSEDILFTESFVADHGLENVVPTWKGGVGTIAVYIGRMDRPVLATLLNLDSTLNLHSGRAWVGFTAATGTAHYQAHDILRWRFSSLREDV